MNIDIPFEIENIMIRGVVFAPHLNGYLPKKCSAIVRVGERRLKIPFVIPDVFLSRYTEAGSKEWLESIRVK